MLFKVEMKVNIPHDMPADVAADIKAREKAYAQDLQQQGKWRHLWRVATPTSAFLMWPTTPSCRTWSATCLCSPIWTSPSRPFAGTRRRSMRMIAERKHTVAI